MYTHVAVDGTPYSFIVGGGHLYRANAGLTLFTDVTPTGVTIDPKARCKMVSLNDQLVFTDNTNTPWIGSNLSATPITATKIDYDGAGTAWQTQDITVYSGCIIAILHQVGGVHRQSDISWSEPGQPAVGWQQLNYDDNWTLEQTGSEPLWAIVGTNVALYYFRQQSIGAISGPVGPNWQTSSTHDAISFNVGTRAWSSVQTFGNYIYFTDQLGRAWRMALGMAPQAIWLYMRAVADAQASSYPAVTQAVTTSAFEAQLNLYLIAPWSSNPGAGQPPTQMYQFDARSGQYVGRWNIKGPGGVGIDAMGSLLDALGSSRLIVLGSRAVAPATSGYVWVFNTITTADTIHMTVEGTSPPPAVLTTEGGLRMTVEGQETNWTDDGFTPDIWIFTSRLGYAADLSWNVDRATIITGSPDPCLVEIMSSGTPNQVVGTPAPGLSSDYTYRLVVGVSASGRGHQLRVSPLSITTQWSINQVAIVAAQGQARPEDA